MMIFKGFNLKVLSQKKKKKNELPTTTAVGTTAITNTAGDGSLTLPVDGVLAGWSGNRSDWLLIFASCCLGLVGGGPRLALGAISSRSLPLACQGLGGELWARSCLGRVAGPVSAAPSRSRRGRLREAVCAIKQQGRVVPLETCQPENSELCFSFSDLVRPSFRALRQMERAKALFHPLYPLETKMAGKFERCNPQLGVGVSSDHSDDWTAQYQFVKDGRHQQLHIEKKRCFYASSLTRLEEWMSLEVESQFSLVGELVTLENIFKVRARAAGGGEEVQVTYRCYDGDLKSQCVIYSVVSEGRQGEELSTVVGFWNDCDPLDIQNGGSDHDEQSLVDVYLRRSLIRAERWLSKTRKDLGACHLESRGGGSGGELPVAALVEGDPWIGPGQTAGAAFSPPPELTQEDIAGGIGLRGF